MLTNYHIKKKITGRNHKNQIIIMQKEEKQKKSIII